jgi:hypothetical protein
MIESVSTWNRTACIFKPIILTFQTWFCGFPKPHRNAPHRANFASIIMRHEAEQLMSYTELCDQIDVMMRTDAEKEENGEAFYFFPDIIAHEGPMTARSINWKGSTWNVQVRWVDGLETWEPLNLMIAQDPVTCASYAK